jgi:hypothetical protein
VQIVTKLTLAAAAFVAAMSVDMPVSQAYGDAPWCAVIELGQGEVYWDCQYRTIDACVPNVIAGNRGFCNVNPYGPGPGATATRTPHRTRHHKAYAHP